MAKETIKTRVKKVIDLTEYGSEGTLTLEPLGFARATELENALGRISDNIDGKMVIGSKAIGDAMNYTALAYITDAPFEVGNYKAYLEFMDSLELQEAFRLLSDIMAYSKEVSDGMQSPFANSTVSGMRNSE